MATDANGERDGQPMVSSLGTPPPVQRNPATTVPLN